jgi:hypothetical protein
MPTQALLLRKLYRSLLRWTRHDTVRKVPFVIQEAGHVLSREVRDFLKSLGPPTQLVLRTELRGADDVRRVVAAQFRSTPWPTDRPAVSHHTFALLRDLERFRVDHLESLLAQRKELQAVVAANGGVSPVPFQVGDVIRHKKFKYRGVVIAWDERPKVDVSGWDGVRGALRAPMARLPWSVCSLYVSVACNVVPWYDRVHVHRLAA